MHLARPAGVGGDLEPGLAALQLQLAMLPINAHMHFAARRPQDMRSVRQRFVADFASGGAQHLRGRRRGRAAIQSKRAQQQRRNTGFTQVAAAPALLLALKAGGGGTGLPQLLQVLVLQGMARVGLAPLVERVLIAFAVVPIQPPAGGFACDGVLAHGPGTCCRATRARSRWPCEV
ncbi:hypothetical protein G6F40_015624 [Rhizopus arrhizus]|nr:hypothetical protein G6F40_015624 [Rhizopus arrhizus]